jgi:hypothetical protein
MRINRIVVYLHSRDFRYWGFRYCDCRSGITVSAKISGGQSNIAHALTNDGEEWLSDYWAITIAISEKELFGLPHAGCEPDHIRAWVKQAIKEAKRTALRTQRASR